MSRIKTSVLTLLIITAVNMSYAGPTRKDIKHEASQGNVKAQCVLGTYYAEAAEQAARGEQKESLFQQALEQYQLSATCEEPLVPEAQCNYAYFKEKGIGCEIDMKGALEYYHKAADECHYWPAMLKLGLMYQLGIVEHDDSKAVSYFEKGLETEKNGKGKIPKDLKRRIQYRLGVIYLKGWGVESNQKRALEYLGKSKKSYSLAQAVCAGYFEYKREKPVKVLGSYKEVLKSLKDLKKGWEKNYLNAFVNYKVACLYQNINSSLREKEINYLIEASKAGFSEAKEMLLNHSEQYEFRGDFSQAAAIYQERCDLGLVYQECIANPPAEDCFVKYVSIEPNDLPALDGPEFKDYAPALMRRAELNGQIDDKYKALVEKQYRQAARQGYPAAQWALAEFYTSNTNLGYLPAETYDQHLTTGHFFKGVLAGL